MENISFDSDSLLDYKKIKPSTNPMAFSDQLANQISSKISNLFPKPAEIKKNLVKSITESDDEILDRVGNNEISFSDFHFLLGKNNLNINPSMKARVNGGCSAMYEAMDERYELTFTTPHNR
ncbi:MAG: hypothetical protein EBZ26_06250 [Flavobacteriia bacterium]|nr:hypothetical protein [Flavobacteriia bacterium]